MKKVLAIGRGIIKAAIPGVTPIIEAGKNLTTPPTEPQPHSWWSIGVQLATLAFLIYALSKGWIPVQDVIDYLKSLGG